jgi:hypothetical protein
MPPTQARPAGVQSLVCSDFKYRERTRLAHMGEVPVWRQDTQPTRTTRVPPFEDLACRTVLRSSAPQGETRLTSLSTIAY